MYIPAAFHESDPETIAQFLRNHSFASLITYDPSLGLFASHIPILLNPTAPGQPPILSAHLARQNPQWQSFREDTEVLVIFQGPHAYISPRWYEAKLAVPTWNYTAVHAYARPSIIADPAAIRDLLTHITAAYEPQDGWKISAQPDDFMEKLTAQIVAFTLTVTRLEAKFKLNQNRSQADRRSVITHLEAPSPQPSDGPRALAALMRDTLPTDNLEI